MICVTILYTHECPILSIETHSSYILFSIFNKKWDIENIVYTRILLNTTIPIRALIKKLIKTNTNLITNFLLENYKIHVQNVSKVSKVGIRANL